MTDYKRLSRELKELGTFLVSIEGGEPLVRPDLVGIVEALSEHHVTALFTNGWLLTEDLAKSLFDAGLVHANVSIDYPDAKRHDEKRGLDGAFDRAWRAVDYFRDAAPRGGKQTHVMSARQSEHAGCQRCWTACRGFAQLLSNGASVKALAEMSARMRTT